MRENIAGQLNEITDLLACHPEGLARGQIASALAFSINYKTLQRRLAALAASGQVVMKGDKKAARYYPGKIALREASPSYKPYESSFRGYDTPSHDVPLHGAPLQEDKGQYQSEPDGIFSSGSKSVLKFLDSPVHSRAPVSYKREFLEKYVPNETVYVPKKWRESLLAEGQRFDKTLAAGTYARQISQRLLIDLSWNSSRLEGNTYSRLDTQKLIEEGVSAEGKAPIETVMISNHKEAISFLVENAQDIRLDNRTVSSLHYLLAQDLLPNPEAWGKVRTIAVSIGRSAYIPIDNPHMLKELLEFILLKAREIADPFEQSFFLLVHLSYLQAFEDVNKRTSRLSCNIPFIQQNLCPLSFTDVSREDYTSALLAVYEKNQLAPMLDLFHWAYLRSCKQYGSVKESLGEIDAYRVMYRAQRKEAMGRVVRSRLHGADAEQCIADFCAEKQIIDPEKFAAMTLADLDNLHASAIVGLGISETELQAWLAGKT